MTVREAAAILHRSESTVQRLCEQRKITSWKAWRRVRRGKGWTVVIKYVLDPRSVRQYARRTTW